MQNFLPQNTIDRTALDTAIGVLVGRRHCSPRAAFNELAQAAGRTGIGVNALSSALVALASGAPGGFEYRAQVEELWADALGLAERRAADVGRARAG